MSDDAEDKFSDRHEKQRNSKNADDLELSVLLEGEAVVDAGVYDERISGALDDFMPDGFIGPLEEWHADDVALDDAVGGTFEAIHERIQLYGDAYPFRLRGNSLIRRTRTLTLYDFFLCLTQAPELRSGEFRKLPRTFERLSCELVQRFLGPTANSIHTGFPRSQQVGRGFSDAMKTLREESGEWTWNPEEELPRKYRFGDQGVDFVVWKNPSKLRHRGHLFFLGQCACGNDWPSKLNDINLNKFRKWFHPACCVWPPVRVFATPFHLSEANHREVSREAGLVFDRSALTTLSIDHAVNQDELMSRYELYYLIDVAVESRTLQIN